jgi:hypothetical protein
MRVLRRLSDRRERNCSNDITVSSQQSNACHSILAAFFKFSLFLVILTTACFESEKVLAYNICIFLLYEHALNEGLILSQCFFLTVQRLKLTEVATSQQDRSLSITGLISPASRIALKYSQVHT